MARKNINDIEKAIVINNTITHRRFEKLESSIKMAVDALQSNNELINKLIDDNVRLEKRVRELENFANRIIETNKMVKQTINSTPTKKK